MTAAKQPSTNVSVLQPKKGQGLIGFLWASLDCELTLPTRCHSFHKQKSSQNEHFSFQIRPAEYLVIFPTYFKLTTLVWIILDFRYIYLYPTKLISTELPNRNRNRNFGRILE